MSQIAVNKVMNKLVNKSSNKRKRSPAINKISQQNIPRKKLKTSTIPIANRTNNNNNTAGSRSHPPKYTSTSTNNIKPHSNGTIKPRLNGNINYKINTTNKHKAKPTIHSNDKQMQSQIASITKQKKQLMDANHKITSSFKGMWKSRETPKHLLKTSTNTTAKAMKTVVHSPNNDSNRGLKRRASGPPTQQQPAAKRQKIAPKAQSQDVPSNNKSKDEPPPLVTLTQLKWKNNRNLSDYRLGIKPSDNGHGQSPKIYKTGLSQIASHHIQCGIFEDEDLDQMIHQHKVLANKLKGLRDESGCNIPKQFEPINNRSPWDCVLDEVCHIATDINNAKLQTRRKNKILSTAIKQNWTHKLHRKYKNKYQNKAIEINHRINNEFKMQIKTKVNTNNNAKISKTFKKKPSIEIAKCIKTFWNGKFKQFAALKNEFISSQSFALKPNTFLDGVINLHLPNKSHTNVDKSLLENIKKYYEIEHINTANASSYDIKQRVLAKWHGQLLSLSTSNKTTRIRGKFKCKLRDYQMSALKWLISLYENKMNGVLSGDNGSGKTAEIIALFAWLSGDKNLGPHLIVVPQSQILNWQNQFKAHYPQYQTLVYNEESVIGDYKLKHNEWNACIVSYDLATRHSLQFKKIPWQYVIFDQADKIRDFSAAKWHCLFTLNCQFRVLLINNNNAIPFWSMLYCLMPNAFRSKQEFEAWFNANMSSQNNNNNYHSNAFSEQLKHVLSPFIFDHKQSDLKSFPKIVEKQYICHLTQRQQLLYDDCIALYGENTFSALYKLQQICNHPNLYEKCRGEKDIFQCDPISQIDFLFHSANVANIRIIAPLYRGMNATEKYRIETLYKPLFDKVRDCLSKLSKEEKANELEQDDDEDSEETQGTEQEQPNPFQIIMKKSSIPSDTLSNALAMPLKSIVNGNKNKNDESLALPLDIELYCQSLSQFSAKGLVQWNCSKLNVLAELLEDLHRKRHKVILFVSNTRMIDILELFVLIYQYDYIRCDHKIDRNYAIKLFNKFNDDKNILIFIASTRNIHVNQFDSSAIRANTVIYYDHEWDSVIADNVHTFVKRMNGHHDLTIFRLINQNTIEDEIFNHYSSDLSKLSVSNLYSQNRKISLHRFNDIVATIGCQLDRESILTFYHYFNKYNAECGTRVGAECAQYIEFIVNKLVPKNKRERKKKDVFLAKLLSEVGFQKFINVKPKQVIDAQFYATRNKLKLLRKRCGEFVSDRNDNNDVVMVDNTNNNKINKRKNCGTFQSASLSVSCFHQSTIKSYLDFNDNEHKNEIKSKKSDKMEIDADEDDDANLSVIDPKNIPVTPIKVENKRKKAANYRVLNERRHTLQLLDEFGDYYQHLHETYEPYGVIIDNCKMDNYLNNAIQKSMKENQNNPNYWNLYLDYDYNRIDQDENVKPEEKSIRSNDSESMIEKMQLLFSQWKSTNNKMYKQHGIIPGYKDRNNIIKTCNIDPKTNAIIYGTLDDFVRHIGDAYISKSYLNEKRAKEKSQSIEQPPPISVSSLPPLTSSISEPLTNANSNTLNPPTTPAKRIKLKITNINADANSDDMAFIPDDDIYYLSDNNVFSRAEEAEILFGSLDYALPVKVYDDENKLSAFDYEIYKIKHDWKTGDKALNKVIAEFKFTPKAQQMYSHGLDSPASSVGDHDSYRTLDEGSPSPSSSDSDNVHGSAQSSSSPIPNKMEESSPSASVALTAISPNTQKKQDLLRRLRLPHNRRAGTASAYNANTSLPPIHSNSISNTNTNHKHAHSNADDSVSIAKIHKWLKLRNDSKPPSQSTPLKCFKTEPKKEKNGATRYDPKVHPTIFSSKEIGELHHIVNSFASKTKGRRNVSWRMIKQTFKTKQNTNMRNRTRFELLQVYHKTSGQCKRKDLESLSYFGLCETTNLSSKKHKKSKRTAFWDARFVELQEKKGRGNKKLFKEPLDFDDKKLNAMTKKMTKRMVKELDVCISRVVDLTPDNKNKDEHASHQQTIKSAYQKLNLIVQGQKPYAPNYIWKNHWGQLPVNPYTKPNISHHHPQQANNVHPSIQSQPSLSRPTSLHNLHPHHTMPSHMTPSHLATAALHGPPHLAPSQGHSGPPLGPHPPHPGNLYHHTPMRGSRGVYPGIPATHGPTASHSGYGMPANPNLPPSRYHPSYYPVRGVYPYAHPSYPHPNAPSNNPSRTAGVTGAAASYQSRVAPHGYPSATGYPYHPSYMTAAAAAAAGMGALQRVPGTNPNVNRAPRGYPQPMGAATAAPQQHSSYARNNTNNQNQPTRNPTQTHSNPNPRQQQQAMPPSSAGNVAANANISNNNAARMNSNVAANAGNPRMPGGVAYGRRAPPYAPATRVTGASLAGSGGPPSSYTHQQRQHINAMRQQQRAQYQAGHAQSAAAAQYQRQAQSNNNNNANANQPGNRNRNIASPHGPVPVSGHGQSNNNNNHPTPSQQGSRSSLSQPPRLEQHTTNNGNRAGMNKSQFMNSPRPSLPGTISHDNSGRNAASKQLAPLHSTALFKNARNKQYGNGTKKQTLQKQQQQNPFGPTNNKNTTNAPNTLGLPAINGSNAKNMSKNASDHDLNKHETESEATNGFVSMPAMGSVANVAPITRINQAMNPTALPSNLLMEGQLQRESFNNQPGFYANHTNNAAQTSSLSNNNNNATPSHGSTSSQSSIDTILTRNFHRHRTNHNKAQKHTVVTNGNGRSHIKPSNLPRNNGNNPPQAASPSVISSNSSIANAHNATPQNNANNRPTYHNSNGAAMRSNPYYNQSQQQRHQMMNGRPSHSGHSVRSRVAPSRQPGFVNSNNNQAYSAPPQHTQHTQHTQRPPQHPQQSYRGMHPPSQQAPPQQYRQNNVNNMNRGIPR